MVVCFLFDLSYDPICIGDAHNSNFGRSVVMYFEHKLNCVLTVDTEIVPQYLYDELHPGDVVVLD